MSFIDPDLRERWAKDAEVARAYCKINGHTFVLGKCKCGEFDTSPKVVLQSDTYRAVHLQGSGVIVFEQKGKDAKGDDRWNEIDRLTSITPRGDDKSLYHIYNLLTVGKVP